MNSDPFGASHASSTVERMPKPMQHLDWAAENWLYQGLFQHSVDGICLTHGNQGHIIETNPAFQQLLGYSPVAPLPTTLPELVVKFPGDFQDFLSSDRPIYPPDSPEMWLCRQDRTPIPVVLRSRVALSGGVSVFCFAPGETELFSSEILKQATAQITETLRGCLEEQQIFQVAVAGITDGFAVQGCNATVYSADRSTCTLVQSTLSPTPILNTEIYLTSTHPEIYDHLLQRQPVQFCSLEATAQHPHGRSSVLACPIFDGQTSWGDLWLFRQGHETYTEAEVNAVQHVASQCAIALRQARIFQATQAQVETLEHLNQLKDNFISTVSHELRTPISTIKMAIQMLTLALSREGVLIPENGKPTLTSNKIARYLKILHDECNREIELVSDLLDFQKLETGAPSCPVQPIELYPYLLRILRPFKDQASRQHQSLRIKITPNLPIVLSNPQNLERILVELLTNACKYSPEGQEIWVRAGVIDRATWTGEAPEKPTEQAGDRSVSEHDLPVASALQIHVINSGTEIPADQIGRIFDKFYRIPSPDPHRHSGMGLGLALVKKLVVNLGGTVQAESESGQTHFKVELPIAIVSSPSQVLASFAGRA